MPFYVTRAQLFEFWVKLGVEKIPSHLFLCHRVTTVLSDRNIIGRVSFRVIL